MGITFDLVSDFFERLTCFRPGNAVVILASICTPAGSITAWRSHATRDLVNGTVSLNHGVLLSSFPGMLMYSAPATSYQHTSTLNPMAASTNPTNRRLVRLNWSRIDQIFFSAHGPGPYPIASLNTLLTQAVALPVSPPSLRV